jgi:hypothetical protein
MMFAKALSRVAVLVLMVWLGIACESGAVQAAKLALVIGNEGYSGPDLPPLPGVETDAEKLADTLKLLGFTVAQGSAYANLQQAAFRNAIAAFLSTVSGGDTVIVYYGGHGIQANGVNYLLPIGADPAYPGTSIDLDGEILGPLGLKHTAALVVVVDACRNLPSLPIGGFAQPSAAPVNSFVFFSTGPNKTAVNPSPFTRSLIDHLAEPGERLEDIAAEVISDVMQNTNDTQKPQAYDTLSNTAGAPVILRAPSAVTMHAADIDDDLYVMVDGNLICQWSVGQCNGRQILLKKGPHPVVVRVFNKQSYTGGFKQTGGHKPEGWYYHFSVDYRSVSLVELADREDRPEDQGPRHGKTFDVATFTLNVDPHTGAVELTDLRPHAWR